jgi:hypothetical protein
MAQEGLEHRELAGGELDRASVDAGAAGAQVERDLAVAYTGCGLGDVLTSVGTSQRALIALGGVRVEELPSPEPGSVDFGQAGPVAHVGPLALDHGDLVVDDLTGAPL